MRTFPLLCDLLWVCRNLLFPQVKCQWAVSQMFSWSCQEPLCFHKEKNPCAVLALHKNSPKRSWYEMRSSCQARIAQDCRSAKNGSKSAFWQVWATVCSRSGPACRLHCISVRLQRYQAGGGCLNETDWGQQDLALGLDGREIFCRI